MPYKDPIKQKEAQHKHYIKNKDRYTKSSIKSKPKFRLKRSEWLQTIKAERGCKICGEARAACLDFHHKNIKTKKFTIGEVVWAISKEKILEEIKKCDVLCRNCHAILHWKENQKKFKLSKQNMI